MGFLKLQFVAKYGKKEGGDIGDIKKFWRKTKIENFEQPHSIKKCKRGDRLGIFNIHAVAKLKGDPLVESKKFRNKVSLCRKKSK